jgi:cobalt-zinc-cadmium resistance protein CzcA
MLALAITRTPFSVSSGIGFLALFQVISSTNRGGLHLLRKRARLAGRIIDAARRGGAVETQADHDDGSRAALGLLPAISTSVGSVLASVCAGDPWQAVLRLLISVLLMPVLYAIAKEDDHLEVWFSVRSHR